jgi:ABC-type transporter Mla maintaining outer membrane lipid asymmetry ATPase subunit MlaF
MEKEMPNPILVVKDLTKKYGDHIIFHDIDMIINEGDTDVLSSDPAVPVKARCCVASTC